MSQPSTARPKSRPSIAAPVTPEQAWLRDRVRDAHWARRGLLGLHFVHRSRR
jgi:hypothetical protein